MLPALSVRVNSNEDTWTRRWTNAIEWGTDIAIDSQDNIYVLGNTQKSGGDRNICLLKYNKNGDLIWDIIWNEETDEYGATIAIDKAENVYIAGTKSYDALIIKCDPEGNKIWNRTWGGSDHEECFGLIIDSFNNSYIVGVTESFGTGWSDIFITKFNSSGSKLWNITWGTSGAEFFNAVTIDTLDNIYIAGAVIDSTPYPILVKLNSSGTQLWNITTIGYINFQDLTTDFEDNIIFGNDRVLQKFNSSGEMIWTQNLTKSTFGLNLATDSYGNIFIAENRITPCPPDNMYFIISSCICTTIYLEKYNSSGSFIWEKRCTGCTDSQSSGISLDSLDNIYIIGTLCSNSGCNQVFDIILIKNPKHVSGICIEIYYDLIGIFASISGLGIIVIGLRIRKKRRAKADFF